MKWLQTLIKRNTPERELHIVKKMLSKLKVQPLESTMIEGVLLARHTSARELMVPRVDVFSLDVDLNKKEAMKLVAKGNHSRFPVYEENIDNIIGIVHLRDIFKAVVSGKKNFSLHKLISEPYFIPESRPALDVLEDLKKRHMQMAIVVDEYGGFSGVITMEDITEEVIGDVQDEWDDEAESATLLPEGEYSLDPRLTLKEVNELLSCDLHDDNAETLGGFVINLFGRLPNNKETITANGFLFEVKTKKKNAIRRLHVKRVQFHNLNIQTSNDKKKLATSKDNKKATLAPQRQNKKKPTPPKKNPVHNKKTKIRPDSIATTKSKKITKLNKKQIDSKK